MSVEETELNRCLAKLLDTYSKEYPLGILTDGEIWAMKLGIAFILEGNHLDNSEDDKEIVASINELSNLFNISDTTSVEFFIVDFKPSEKYTKFSIGAIKQSSVGYMEQLISDKRLYSRVASKPFIKV